MTDSGYTPDEVELRDCYAQHMREYAGEDYAAAQDDAVRGIAQIKADALREAAREFALSPHISHTDLKVRERLESRADRIERGER